MRSGHKSNGRRGERAVDLAGVGWGVAALGMFDDHSDDSRRSLQTGRLPRLFFFIFLTYEKRLFDVGYSFINYAILSQFL